MILFLAQRVCNAFAVCINKKYVYLYFIEYITTLLFIQYIGGGKNIYVAPFVDITAFFEEYCSFHSLRHTPVEIVAGDSTFRRVFSECENHDGIRLLRAKGTLNTCEICNNASDMLRNSSKFTIL